MASSSFTRTRESGEIYPGTGTSLGTEWCSGTKIEPVNGNKGTLGTFKRTTDVVTPNYRRLIEDGKIINNPFSSRTEEHDCYVGPYEMKRNTCAHPSNIKRNWGTGWNSQVWNRTKQYPPELVQESVQALSILAGTSAAANVVEDEAMLFVDLAERKKTYSSAASYLSILSQDIADLGKTRKVLRWGEKMGLVKCTGKGRSRQCKVTVGDFIANHWLAYRYFFTPTVMTLGALLDIAITPQLRLRRTSRSKQRDNLPDFEGTEFVGSGGVGWDTSVNYKTKCLVEVRAGVLYEHETMIKHRLGLTFRDIPAAVWEFVPYSFVADWFVNVGDFLRGAVPVAGVNELASWTSVKITEERYCEGVYSFAGAPTYVEVVRPAGWQRVTVTSHSRRPGLSIGIASRVRTIEFDKVLDFKRLADSVALVQRQLTRVINP